MFEQPALDYREFPHFEVRNSLEAQTGTRVALGYTVSSAESI
jgi:hypothetical protein